MVAHFHGSPIWGDKGAVCKIAVAGAGSFVSFFRPDQIELSLRHAKRVGIDNGAYTYQKHEHSDRKEWTLFYAWLMRYYHNLKVDFFVIPDVIKGGEEENDRLIKELPSMFRDKAVPVWHLHESLERLVRLCEEWPRVCFGSSGQYAAIRTKRWHQRMRDGRVLGNYPLDTADSTNLACNVPKYEVKYPELTRAIREADYAQGLDPDELKRLILRRRCAILKGAIEAVRPPTIEDWINNQPAPAGFFMGKKS